MRAHFFATSAVLAAFAACADSLPLAQGTATTDGGTTPLDSGGGAFDDGGGGSPDGGGGSPDGAPELDSGVLADGGLPLFSCHPSARACLTFDDGQDAGPSFGFDSFERTGGSYAQVGGGILTLINASTNVAFGYFSIAPTALHGAYTLSADITFANTALTTRATATLLTLSNAVCTTGFGLAYDWDPAANGNLFRLVSLPDQNLLGMIPVNSTVRVAVTVDTSGAGSITIRGGLTASIGPGAIGNCASPTMANAGLFAISNVGQTQTVFDNVELTLPAGP